MTCGSLTHGHPSGYYSAGALAVMISAAVRGTDLRTAAAAALEALRRVPLPSGTAEVAASLEQAVALADVGSASPVTIAALGEGWEAEEVPG